jgi:hypothetical protein
MANNLKTGWVIIATSGSTIDGRKIEKKWLEDMAENYNEKLYSAKLWPDHERYFGSQGKVLALKVEPAEAPDSKDELQLMAIIAPSDDLVYYNKRGRYVHTSIEVLKNFANKGFFYLGGLAVTDEPASLGTTALQFSEQTNSVVFHGTQLDLSSAEPKGLLDFFSRPKPTEPIEPTEQETNNMTAEQFAAIQAQNQAIADGIAALVEQFKTNPPAPATKPEPVEAEAPTLAQFTALQESVTALTEKLEEFKKTPVGKTTPAGDDQESAVKVY